MKLLSTRLALASAGVALAMAGCKGPAQKVGSGLDEAASGVRDAVSQPGPVEKAGRKLDKVIGD